MRGPTFVHMLVPDKYKAFSQCGFVDDELNWKTSGQCVNMVELEAGKLGAGAGGGGGGGGSGLV